MDKEKNKVYLSINPNQLDIEFLMGFTRQSGDGYQFDGSSMLGEGVFFFKRVGDIVQLVEKNTKFRADESKAISKLVKRNKKPPAEPGAFCFNHFPDFISST